MGGQITGLSKEPVIWPRSIRANDFAGEAMVRERRLIPILRISAGGGTLALSIAGMLICLAGIAVVWVLKGRVEAISNAVFSATDESLVFVEVKTDRVRQALDDSQQRVRGISKLAERLRDEKADAGKVCEPLLQAIDGVFQQLKAAETWLDSSHAAAQAVARLSGAVVSSQYAASHEGATAVALAQRVQEVSEEVAESLATLQVLRQEIVEARETGKLAREAAARAVSRVADLSGALANISARIGEFKTGVASTKVLLVKLQRRIQWWIAVASVGIAATFAWFGISQVVMICLGWRMMRDSHRLAAP